MEGADIVQLSLPAKAENVPLVRHALAGLAEALEMEPAEVSDLKTVVTEACMNVVVHAYPSDQPGPLQVDAWEEGDCMAVSVRDFGRGIRPLADVEQRSLRLGLPLIAALTRGLEISGAPEHGTEVRMRVPLAADGRAVPAEAPEIGDETRIDLPANELLAPVLSRVIAMFAARADFSLDQLSDAVLLSDAISSHGPDDFPDGTARIAVREEDGAFDVRVGPLGDGGGQRLLDGMRIPTIDATLEGLADEIRVERDGAGDLLVIRISRSG